MHLCPTCGRDDFAHERDMKAHHTIAHGESLTDYENPRECPTCGETFANEAGMRAHHKLIHAESIAESRGLPESLRSKVLDRDNGRCRKCGRGVTSMNEDGATAHLHHIIPFSAGGPDHPENLLTLCTRCHDDVHTHMNVIVDERPDLVQELTSFLLES